MSYEEEFDNKNDDKNNLPENIADIPDADTEASEKDPNALMPEYEQEGSDLDKTDDSEPERVADDTDEQEGKKTIDAMKQEIELLKSQIAHLEELKRSQNRILAEIGDFAALFPETPIESIPDSVWESVKNGAPLAASYALYEKRLAAEELRIARINAKNASRSPGSAGTDTSSEYFSPEDVRKMSRAEVHANYSKIKESMKKWMQK